MIIMKARDNTDQWTVGHKSLNGGSSPWNYGLPLNSTASTQTNGGFWNNTAPTSSVFSQGSWDSGNTKVAYCWAAVPGYSAFGSYTGNGSTDGPFVYLGFRPRFILMKASSAVEQWSIWDTSRLGYNPYNAFLASQSSSAEDASSSGSNSNGGPDFLSNGFKMRSNGGSSNNNGVTYVYAAFAENPFKYANAR
jgi:hypothetical protein